MYGGACLLFIILAVEFLFVYNFRVKQEEQFRAFGEIMSSAVRDNNVESAQKAALLVLRNLNGKWIALLDDSGKSIWQYPDLSDLSGAILFRELKLKTNAVSGKYLLVALIPSFPHSTYLFLVILSSLLFLVVLFWIIKGTFKSLSDDLLCQIQKLGSKDEKIFISELEDSRLRINNLRERERCQAEILRKQSKYTAIGQSASMIAHDIRKPLASLKSLLVLLQERHDESDLISDISNRVAISIDKTNIMLNEILEFSKDHTSLERNKCDCQGIITSSLSDVFSGEMDISIDVKYFLSHRNYVDVDIDRVVRVLTNIVLNAVEAMKGKGKIWFKTEDVGENMRLTVGNDGPVVPSDVKNKLFDPFFTANKKGGTGLGLSICQKIIEMHGGTIEVQSSNTEEGPKTEFILTLPAKPGNLTINDAELIHHSDELNAFRDEEAVRVEYGESANVAEFMRIHKAHGRSFNVLIVDDEPLFRETVQSLLRTISQVRDHVKIVECGSAEEALTLFKERAFDYLIADIDLGRNRMNGYELTEKILKQYPETLALIHSNKRREEMDGEIREMRNPHFMGFLPKPMKQGELLQFLARKSFEIRKTHEQPKRKVLVLNDDDALLMSFKILLKSPEIQILEASDVCSALKQYSENHVDIILSDINLGDNEPDGYSFLKEIRKKDREIPFYLVSGYSQSEEEPKAKELGADGYLQLPVDKDQLWDVIN